MRYLGRRAVVRELDVPKGCGASLPYGPAAKVCATDRAFTGTGGGGAGYVGLIRQIEAELCAVENRDTKGAAKRSGREEGAKYVWKNPLGDKPAISARTTAVSRAWRNTAAWLGATAKTKDQKVVNAARWRIIHYAHPKPHLATASAV